MAILLDEMTAGVGPLVKRAVDYIHTHYADEISRQALAEAVGASPAYVTRVFREQTGLTPWQYLNRYRVAQAQRLLRESDATITEIAGLTGFNDSAYFSRIFRRECGSSPNTFRNQTN
ncbi:MAG: AraC family transcriptional regulator [Caldilineaceae bacterium]